MPALAGKTLVDPTDAEVVEAWGVPTTLAEDEREFDVLVVGGGPGRAGGRGLRLVRGVEHAGRRARVASAARPGRAR